MSASLLSAVSDDDSDITDESSEEEEEKDASKSVDQQTEMSGQPISILLDSLNKAALHLRRAMVLFHTYTDIRSPTSRQIQFSACDHTV